MKITKRNKSKSNADIILERTRRIFIASLLDCIYLSFIVEMNPKNEPDPVEGEGGPFSQEREVERVTFDDILLKLGEFGLEQKLVYLMFSLPYIMSAMQLHGWVFVGSEMPHRCRLPGEVGWDNVSFFYDNNTAFESCSRTVENETSECVDGWIYDTTQVGDSVVADWDLVCNKGYLRASVAACQMVGYMMGAFFLGTLADKLGRKPTFLISNTMMAVGGVVAAVAPEYFTFVAGRIIVGFAIAGIENTCFEMNIELVGPSMRTLAGIICWFFETGGLLAALGFAFIVPDNWRLLQTLYSVPAFLFLAYIWVAPESIRWLVANGKNDEARRLIKRAARRNGVPPIKESQLLRMEETIRDESSGRTYTILDLFRGPNLRYKTIILLLCWLTIASLYYVLLLDQSELSDNKYIGFLITASVQIPGYVYVICTLERPMFGRKRSMCMFLILSGITLFSYPFVPESYPAIRITLSVIGRFAANCSYTILNLYTAELFPTVVRGVGSGIAVVFSRIGTILAPYILLLGLYSPLIFGCAAFLTGLCALMLPETLGTPMPETLEDGERSPLVLPCIQMADEREDLPLKER